MKLINIINDNIIVLVGTLYLSSVLSVILMGLLIYGTYPISNISCFYIVGILSFILLILTEIRIIYEIRNEGYIYSFKKFMLLNIVYILPIIAVSLTIFNLIYGLILLILIILSVFKYIGITILALSLICGIKYYVWRCFVKVT